MSITSDFATVMVSHHYSQQFDSCSCQPSVRMEPDGHWDHIVEELEKVGLTIVRTGDPIPDGEKCEDCGHPLKDHAHPGCLIRTGRIEDANYCRCYRRAVEDPETGNGVAWATVER